MTPTSAELARAAGDDAGQIGGPSCAAAGSSPAPVSILPARAFGETVTIQIERTAGKLEHIEVPRRLFDAMLGPVPALTFTGNGMGPRLGDGRLGRFLTWLIPDHLGSWDFDLPSWFHDGGYERGGDREARRERDSDLACNIVTAVRAARPQVGAPRVFGAALIVWWFVRAGGWCAFNYRRRCYSPDLRVRALANLSESPRPRDTFAGRVRALVALPAAAARLAVHVARAR